MNKNVCYVIGTLALAAVASAQQYTIVTFAGIPGNRGWFGDSGPATSAQLDNPTRVTVDPKGNVYFVDYSTYVIRKVDTSGTISTIAGTGTPGYTGDGTAGNTAEIYQISGITVNAGGDVFIADSANHVIRKIAASNDAISTVAGNGTGGYSGDGGTATKAQLFEPINVVVDGSNNLYITDYYNNCIRKVDSSGKISTIAGGPTQRGYSGDGGPAAKAFLSDPYALTMDGAGNLYFSEIGNQVIRKIDSSGNISTFATNISTVSFAVDAAGALFYVDYDGSTIRKILPNGPRVTIAGTGQPGYSGDSGPADIAQLNQPNGLALDSSGKLYVGDSGNELIRQLIPNPFSVAAATNAASNIQNSIVPGEIITIYGAGIGPSQLTGYHVTGSRLDTTVASTTVYIGGIPAPIVYVSATQLAVVVPYGVTGPTTNITVSYQGQASSTLQINVAAASPGLFTANATGQGQAAAINGNGTLNGASNPVRVGDFLSLYMTGDGAATPANVDGAVVTSNPLPVTILRVTASIGGVPALVSYSGAAFGAIAGLTQVNVQVPRGVAAGTAVPVTLTVGGVKTQSGVTISVTN